MMLKRRMSLVVPVVLTLCAVVWQPSVAHAADCILGDGKFSDGGYATPGIWYYYNVEGGPPNQPGDLWVRRAINGGDLGPWQETPGWLRTDVTGKAHKGPWTATYDEYAEAYIEWPESGNCRTETDSHVNNV